MGNGSPRLQRRVLCALPLLVAATLIGAPAAYADAVGVPAPPAVPAPAAQAVATVQTAAAAVTAAPTTAPAAPTPPATPATPATPAPPPVPAVSNEVSPLAATADPVAPTRPVSPAPQLTPAPTLRAADSAAPPSHATPARPATAAPPHGVTARHRGRPLAGHSSVAPRRAEPLHSMPVAPTRPAAVAGTPVPAPSSPDRPSNGTPGGAAGTAPGSVLLVFVLLAAALAWVVRGRGRRVLPFLRTPRSAALVLELERPD